MRSLSILAVSLCSLFPAPFAAAQDGEVPPQLLNTTRRQQGDVLKVCTDAYSPGGAFDAEVAKAIADALFLTVEFHPTPTGFPLNGGGFLAEVQVALNNTCDLMMGMAVQTTSPFPDWATVTRPYASISFVAAVIDPAFTKLGDIPKDRLIGTAVGSKAEQVFLTWLGQQPEDQRWNRLPYADPHLMLKRLRDGRIGGMMLYQPAFLQLMREDKEGGAMPRSVPFDPVPMQDVRVGGIVNTRDTFLRSQVDEAIDALVADGTIAAIMERMEIIGTPGG